MRWRWSLTVTLEHTTFSKAVYDRKYKDYSIVVTCSSRFLWKPIPRWIWPCKTQWYKRNELWENAENKTGFGEKRSRDSGCVPCGKHGYPGDDNQAPYQFLEKLGLTCGRIWKVSHYTSTADSDFMREIYCLIHQWIDLLNSRQTPMELTWDYYPISRERKQVYRTYGHRGIQVIRDDLSRYQNEKITAMITMNNHRLQSVLNSLDFWFAWIYRSELHSSRLLPSFLTPFRSDIRISPSTVILSVFSFPLSVHLSRRLTMSQTSLLNKSSGFKAAPTVPGKLKIKVPKFDNSELIQRYSKTLIGRCMNPREQNVSNLLYMLPRIWNVEDRVGTADLGLGRFQIDFDLEEPFHFDYWMLSVVRWEPIIDVNYPSAITFWVKVIGLPLHYWAIMIFESIDDGLGFRHEVDLDEGRIRVTINGFKPPLCFETVLEFEEGHEMTLQLRYERLFGYCRNYYSLCHDSSRCSLRQCDEVVSNKRRGPTEGKEGTVMSYKVAVD